MEDIEQANQVPKDSLFSAPDEWKPGQGVKIQDPKDPNKFVEIPASALETVQPQNENVKFNAEIGMDTSNTQMAKPAKKGKKKKKKRLVQQVPETNEEEMKIKEQLKDLGPEIMPEILPEVIKEAPQPVELGSPVKTITKVQEQPEVIQKEKSIEKVQEQPQPP